MANLEIQCTSFRNYHQVNYTFDKWSDASFVENIFMIHVFTVFLQN